MNKIIKSIITITTSIFILLSSTTPIFVSANAYKPDHFGNVGDINQIESYLRNPANGYILEAIKQQKWFFSHASVGQDISSRLTSDPHTISGLSKLNADNPEVWPLVVRYVDDVSTPPATSIAGSVYGYNHGNPSNGKLTKIVNFAENIDVWKDSVNVAMTKLCYIDINSNTIAGNTLDEKIINAMAAADDYYSRMRFIQNDNPRLNLVLMTCPLEKKDGDNVLKHFFNLRLRSICNAANRKTYLLDIANIEAYNSSNNTYSYNTNPVYFYGDKIYVECLNPVNDCGDGAHLSEKGAEAIAKAWYSVAAKIAYDNVHNPYIPPSSVSIMINSDDIYTPVRLTFTEENTQGPYTLYITKAGKVIVKEVLEDLSATYEKVLPYGFYYSYVTYKTANEVSLPGTSSYYGFTVLSQWKMDTGYAAKILYKKAYRRNTTYKRAIRWAISRGYFKKGTPTNRLLSYDECLNLINTFARRNRYRSIGRVDYLNYWEHFNYAVSKLKRR